MAEPELIPLKHAREILGVSHTTMARLVKEGHFTIYQNPLDRRQKLVDMREVRGFATPLPMHGEQGDAPGAEAVRFRDPQEADDEYQAARQLLRILIHGGRLDEDAPFIQTQVGDLIHPGLSEGRINVPAPIFNRLLREGFLKVLSGVYHRRGNEMGREFVITQAGHEIAARR